MNTHRTWKGRSLTQGSLGLCLLLLATLSACGTSQDVDFDPQNAEAGFALAQKPTGAEAGAIFKVPGTLRTTTHGIESVVLVGPLPQETRTVLRVERNQLGAPYFRVDLDEPLALGTRYRFEVNLTDGTTMETIAIRTPTDPPTITPPSPNVTLRKNDRLEVDWAGATEQPNHFRISIRQRTDDVITILGVGIEAPDTGTFRGAALDGQVMHAMGLDREWAGRGYLILNRMNQSTPGGFAPFSVIQAGIVDWIPVTVVEE